MSGWGAFTGIFWPGTTERCGTPSEKSTLIINDATRILNPKETRRNMLQTLHLPHIGFLKTLLMAREKYWWELDVNGMCFSCGTCLHYSPIKRYVRPTTDIYPFNYAGKWKKLINHHSRRQI
jgi:hypothetical protein